MTCVHNCGLLMIWLTTVYIGYENGNFVGPTILHKVKPNIKCYTEELVSILAFADDIVIIANS